MDSEEKSFAPKFKDETRQIDMVLSYTIDKSKPDYQEANEKRRIFEENLIIENFELEKDDELESDEEMEKTVQFVRIHMPVETEKRLMKAFQVECSIKELCIDETPNQRQEKELRSVAVLNNFPIF
jgi:hypothetical protein